MDKLIAEITKCRVCQNHFSHKCRPVVSAHPQSKIVIIGQAPGRKVHLSGIPWDDKSGQNLRSWLGVSSDQFYAPTSFALVPMGFCYPGTGTSGDLAPRPECAPLWHKKLLDSMKELRLILLIGNYAQKYYLGDNYAGSLTATVGQFKSYLPNYFPLPHPSPRNNIWRKKNPWFEIELLPDLKKTVQQVLS